MIPENTRERFYMVVPMPVDKYGMGPASHILDEVEKMTYEVWDQVLNTHYSSEYLQDAIQKCEELNKEYYK